MRTCTNIINIHVCSQYELLEVISTSYSILYVSALIVMLINVSMKLVNLMYRPDIAYIRIYMSVYIVHSTHVMIQSTMNDNIKEIITLSD